LDEYVEAAKLVANPLRRGGDRCPICYVQLERACLRPNFFGCGLAALEIAGPD
jgi:hypothetical protein